VYCSKCGAAMPDGSAFCSACGRSFSVPAALLRSPALTPTVAAPRAAGGVMSAPAYASIPHVEYAGFWLRVLVFVIDNVVIGVGVIAIVIPLFFLTGLGALLTRVAHDEEISDAGIFLIFGLILAAATVSLLVTWLYHALMESSEWQATVGKRALGLLVTDMAGQRVSFGRSSGRHFGKIITNLVPAFLGYIMAAFTEKRQALHDMMAGCLVLRRTI
jgi:uncharacterized RDD family membrane protein YckC